MRQFLNRLLYNRTNQPIVQFLRYGVTGSIAFVVDYATLYALTEWAGLHYLVSAALAYLLSAVVNYLLSIGWVFNHSRKDRPLLVLSVFIAIGAVGLGLTELLMWVLTDKLDIYYMVSKIVATVMVAFWNFGARRLFIQKM